MGNGQFGVYFVGSGPAINEGNQTDFGANAPRDYERVLYKTGRFPYSPDSTISTPFENCAPTFTTRRPISPGSARVRSKSAGAPANKNDITYVGTRPIYSGALERNMYMDSRAALASCGCTNFNNNNDFPGTKNFGQSRYGNNGRYNVPDYNLNFSKSSPFTPLSNGRPASTGSDANRNQNTEKGKQDGRYMNNGKAGRPSLVMPPLPRNNLFEDQGTSPGLPDRLPKGAQTDPSPWVLYGDADNGKFMSVSRSNLTSALPPPSQRGDVNNSLAPFGGFDIAPPDLMEASIKDWGWRYSLRENSTGYQYRYRNPSPGQQPIANGSIDSSASRDPTASQDNGSPLSQQNGQSDGRGSDQDQGVPPLSQQQDPLSGQGQRFSPLNQQQGPVSGQWQGQPSLSQQQGPLSGQGQRFSPLNQQQGPLSGQWQGQPPLSQQQGPFSGQGQRFPPLNQQQGPLSGQGQRFPPLNQQQGPLSGQGQGQTPLSHQQGPLSAQGQRFPALNQQQGPLSGQGQRLPPLSQQQGPLSGQGQGQPALSQGKGPLLGHGNKPSTDPSGKDHRPSLDQEYGPGSNERRTSTDHGGHSPRSSLDKDQEAMEPGVRGNAGLIRSEPPNPYGKPRVMAMGYPHLHGLDEGSPHDPHASRGSGGSSGSDRNDPNRGYTDKEKERRRSFSGFPSQKEEHSDRRTSLDPASYSAHRNKVGYGVTVPTDSPSKRTLTHKISTVEHRPSWHKPWHAQPNLSGSEPGLSSPPKPPTRVRGGNYTSEDATETPGKANKKGNSSYSYYDLWPDSQSKKHMNTSSSPGNQGEKNGASDSKRNPSGKAADGPILMANRGSVDKLKKSMQNPDKESEQTSEKSENSRKVTFTSKLRSPQKPGLLPLTNPSTASMRRLMDGNSKWKTVPNQKFDSRIKDESFEGQVDDKVISMLRSKNHSAHAFGGPQHSRTSIIQSVMKKPSYSSGARESPTTKKSIRFKDIPPTPPSPSK